MKTRETFSWHLSRWCYADSAVYDKYYLVSSVMFGSHGAMVRDLMQILLDFLHFVLMLFSCHFH